jgi:Domain of unknown function (DUF1905)/Bacteriocin-protection, YdeI or OmpD-Associated
MSKRFQAKLQSQGPSGAWTRLNISFDVEKAFGSRGRVSVKGTINGFAFRTSVFPNGDGTHHMMVNKAMQQGAKAGPGDKVKLTLERDDQPRTVEIPPAMAIALATNAAAKAAFVKLAPSHKQEFVGWVNEAKQEATRLRRLEKMLQMLKAGKKLKT